MAVDENFMNFGVFCFAWGNLCKVDYVTHDKFQFMLNWG